MNEAVALGGFSIEDGDQLRKVFSKNTSNGSSTTTNDSFVQAPWPGSRCARHRTDLGHDHEFRRL